MKGVHWIDLGQWPINMAVIGCEDAYRRFMRGYTPKGTESVPFPRHGGGHCQQMEDGAGNMMLVITAGKQPSRAELVLTLAHEATHAMRWLLEFVGEHKPGTETEAYLVEHITRHSLAALTAKKRR